MFFFIVGLFAFSINVFSKNPETKFENSNLCMIMQYKIPFLNLDVGLLYIYNINRQVPVGLIRRYTNAGKSKNRSAKTGQPQ